MAARILIADDNDRTRTALRNLLTRAGFSVCGEANDGFSAVERATELLPDVVILDLAMPKMSGIEAIPAIKRSSPQTRIVLFTLYESILGKMLAQTMGIDRIVSKDAPFNTLFDEVQSVLSKPSSIPS